MLGEADIVDAEIISVEEEPNEEETDE